MGKLLLVACFSVFSLTLFAQVPPPGHPLSDYVGTYDYMPGQALEIVVGSELFAVIDAAKYKLQRSGTDEFTNAGGEKIPFLRDHSSDSPGRETVIDSAPDWVKATLDLPMIDAPGTKGYYCSGGVAVVGRTIENAVHMPLPDFAQANLFGPLGMSRSEWTRSSRKFIFGCGTC